MFETASEIVIWMVLAALVGFATGWALRSVVANRARARLSERLDEKRREAQDLRDELRHLRGDDDEDVVHVPSYPGGERPWAGDDDAGEAELEEEDQPEHLATAEHDEVELGPLDEPTAAQDDDEDEDVGGATRTMGLDEVIWEDVEDPPRKRDDEA